MTDLMSPTVVDADSPASDPFLTLDLDGLRLIEASAGTGKTFTLATLFTRLVIERDLRVGQILAVTYTEAATQELRERMRRRLQLAACIAADGGDAGVDPADSEQALCRALIAAQRQREDAATLCHRLQRAARDMDLAAVFTIHGFCARVLGEHPLETGQPFIAPEMVGSERELLELVAIDLWRMLGNEADSAPLLQRQWPGGPESLVKDLGPLVRTPVLLPPPDAETVDPLPALQAAATTLREAFALHGEDLRAQLGAAIAGKVLNGGSYKAGSPDDLCRKLRLWCEAQTHHPLDEKLERLMPATLLARTNKGKHALTPSSPLCEAVAAYIDASHLHEAWLAQRGIALLHRVRNEARLRLAALKRSRREQTYDDLIADVATALDSAHGDALVDSLRAQYAVALVDEFQDTDPRQWGIFERVFGGRALFLIGDPKQAIYRFRGGDVHTYLGAAAKAQPAPALLHNFRSRPLLLLSLELLYRNAGMDAFADPRIVFRAVQPGGNVADDSFLRNGAIAPAITVRVLPAPQDERKLAVWSAPESRQHATDACVDAIHAVLSDAFNQHATIDGRPVQPGDIAVLVRKHDEATQIRDALAIAGIPAVAAGRQSLFATEQAQELLSLFEALLRPGDEGRLRAVLASVLIGLDAHAIVHLDDDDVARQAWFTRAATWRERWEHHGPLALVSDLCAEHAARLLRLVDGERRLGNLLQLAERLQEADAHALGLHGLVDWLRARIAEADPADDTQQLRLESDAQRVQILTLHKSKGLEFPLVFLPFAAIGKDSKSGQWCEYPDAQGRVLQFKTQTVNDGATTWDDARARAAAEERAEDARLLYVGLTRAQHAVWLATGPLYRAATTPLAAMLGDISTLEHLADGGLLLDQRELQSTPLAPLPPAVGFNVAPARIAQRVLSRDWWIYSFSQLTNEATSQLAQLEEGAEDETQSPATAFDNNRDHRFTGSRFGNVLHMALEHVDFVAWQGCGDSMPIGQDAPLRAALRSEGYSDEDIEDGLPLLARLVAATLNSRLPEGVRLSELADDARRAEMEFHFALQPTALSDVLALLHAHDILLGRHAFGARRRLEGLMTGKIDLTYTHGGQFFLLDYKSNRLPSYDAASLATAMDASEYTLQALIYTLAVHRWLRFRLGADYDYHRDFGGVRYLFCRGMEAASTPAPGVHAWKPPAVLVDALDALFARNGVAT
jgi:exodeoxyribonuclease V beta subunit